MKRKPSINLSMIAERGDLVCRDTEAIYERYIAEDDAPVSRLVDDTMLYASRGAGKVGLLVTGTSQTVIFYVSMDDMKAVIAEAEKVAGLKEES